VFTDDEAFIRAIVAAPADDAPRLVYADWLDERGDPRGTYLRAEIAWVARRAGRGRVAVRKVPKGVDPVWAARMCRPPFGVCCSHLAMSSHGTNDPADVDAVEAEIGVKLPPQLRALLLNYSLGHLKGGPFILPRGVGGRKLAIDGFACLTDPNWDEGQVSNELVDRTEYLRDEYGLGGKLLYLAGTFDETTFVISGRRTDLGTIHRTDAEQMQDEPGTGVERIAASLGEFLALLKPRTWPLTDELDDE
jgi:uncharacterized protein (TIGR02996 family)